MYKTKLSLLTGGLAVSLLFAGSAGAQETGNVIGPPQLRDFSLQPQERIVTQPTPPAPAPVQVTPPPPTQPQPAAPTQRREPARQAPQQQGAPAQTPAQAPAAPVAPPVAETPAPIPVPPPTSEPAAPEAAPAATPVERAPAGTPYWLYAVGLLAIGLGAFALLRRRRRRDHEIAEASAAAAPEAPAAAPTPRAPAAEPGPRPWVEIEVKAERAAFTQHEATVNFELAITNSGPVAAHNLRVDVKLINAGAEQDKEIGAFFRTAGRESTKLNLPGINPDSTGVIQGEVGMRVEDMKAVTLDGRMLFIPVMAVNILYEWGDGRTGQSSRSYVVGRELEAASEKMGAFRVDQGPRIWRTVGQRPHKITRRI